MRKSHQFSTSQDYGSVVNSQGSTQPASITYWCGNKNGPGKNSSDNIININSHAMPIDLDEFKKDMPPFLFSQGQLEQFEKQKPRSRILSNKLTSLISNSHESKNKNKQIIAEAI